MEKLTVYGSHVAGHSDGSGPTIDSIYILWHRFDASSDPHRKLLYWLVATREP